MPAAEQSTHLGDLNRRIGDQALDSLPVTVFAVWTLSLRCILEYRFVSLFRETWQFLENMCNAVEVYCKFERQLYVLDYLDSHFLQFRHLNLPSEKMFVWFGNYTDQ